MKIHLNLRMFSGSLTLTKYNDAGYSTCTASATTSLAEDDEVTMTLVYASGYEFDECEIIAGGCTYNPSTKKIKMGASNAVVYFKSKANNKYIVTEDCHVGVNNATLELKKNTVLVKAANGAIIDVTNGGGTAISTCTGAIDGLITSGVLVKL